MSSYWIENNYSSQGSIVASIKIIGSMGILYEIEVLKTFFATGNYKKEFIKGGEITSLTDDDVQDERETIKFVLDELWIK